MTYVDVHSLLKDNAHRLQCVHSQFNRNANVVGTANHVLQTLKALDPFLDLGREKYKHRVSVWKEVQAESGVCTCSCVILEELPTLAERHEQE